MINSHWLTRRESEIAELVAAGLSNKEIAQQLGIRNQTVRNILSIVFRKTSIHRRTQLAVQLVISEYEAVQTD